MSLIRTGGRTFDRTDKHVYFIASNVERMKYGAQAHDHLLVAVNDISSPTEMEPIDGWLKEGKCLFLDSGVFTLAMDHARAHNVSHDIALNLAPTDIDGFDDLFKRYVDLATTYGDRLWGYVEIDQGGRDNKIKTRAKLESLGLRPIPVYHPFGDGWDYFDYLAQRYDRICLGNIVQANAPTRLRLLATIYQRKQKYPHLWVHGLGYTPNIAANAFPMDSFDSSTWLSSVRWAGYFERAACATIGPLPKTFQYRLGSDRDGADGARKSSVMAGYGAWCIMQNWRALLEEREQWIDPIATSVS